MKQSTAQNIREYGSVKLILSHILFSEDYKKKAKITKQAPAFKNYGHTYNVKTQNSFNPELQLRNTEFGIKIKLKNLLNELRSFKLVENSVLKLKEKQ